MTSAFSYSQALISSYPDGLPGGNGITTPMKTNDIRGTIAEILHIPNDDNWMIQDSIPEKNLYLIYYTEHADLNRYGNLRGIIVDTDAKAIVSRGRGYVPVVTTDNITPDEKGELHLTDEYKYSYTVKDFAIQRGFEGTTIYRFKHNGIVYFSTNKIIDATRSRWGAASKQFKEIYDELGGPKDNDLFDSETLFSPYVHEFLIVHPDLLIVTKLPIGTGFICYLGCKVIWDVKNSPFSNYNPDRDDDIMVVAGIDKVPINTKVPVVHLVKDITLQEANKHLQYGFYEEQDFSQIDSRLTSAEFVVLYSFNEKKEVQNVIKIQSTAYAWRDAMRKQNNNLKYRFYELVTKSYFSNQEDPEDIYDIYLEEFPVMTPREIKELENLIHKEALIVYPQEQDYTGTRFMSMLEKKEQRLYNIFLCFLMAVPLHQQEQVLGLYPEFEKDRMDLIYWIQRLRSSGIDLKSDEKYRRVENIVSVAYKQANFSYHNPQNDRNGHKGQYGQTVDSIYCKNVYSFIMKERGDSLYRLVKLMHEHTKDKDGNTKVEKVTDNI